MNAAAVDDQLALGRARTLLIVEDDVLARYAVCDALRYGGFTVVEASSAEEAIAVLSSVAVDLVFLDLNIPSEGEGVSVARFAKDHCPGIKVIFTSGRPPADASALLQGLGPFVRKPYLISKVLQLIRRSLTDGQKS